MKFTLLKAAMTASVTLLHASAAIAMASPVAESTMTDEGCYSSFAPLVFNNTYTFQSYGWCQRNCTQLNMPVMATTKGSDCYCGSLLPDINSKTADSNCNSPCNGYGTDTCGGQGFWGVRLTGLQSNVANYGSAASGSSTFSSVPTEQATATTQSSAAAGSSYTTTTQAPSVITEAGQTIIITASSVVSPTAAASSSGGPSKTSIAAGVVVGVVAVAAIIGGTVFLVKSRRRKALEEEYRRNAAISRFVAVTPPKSEGSTNDARLDPSMMNHRRFSDGSIADERDFSRRILQVRNPDGV